MQLRQAIISCLLVPLTRGTKQTYTHHHGYEKYVLIVVSRRQILADIPEGNAWCKGEPDREAVRPPFGPFLQGTEDRSQCFQFSSAPPRPRKPLIPMHAWRWSDRVNSLYGPFPFTVVLMPGATQANVLPPNQWRAQDFSLGYSIYIKRYILFRQHVIFSIFGSNKLSLTKVTVKLHVF